MGEPSAAGDSSKKRRRRKRKSAAGEDAKGEDHNDETAVGPKKGEDHNDDKAPAEFVIDRVGNTGTDAVAEEVTQNDNEDEGDDTTKEPKKRKRKRNRKKKSDGGGTANDNDGATNNNEANESDPAKLQSVEHTVFIEGLPFSSTEEEIHSFFISHGCNDILQLRLPTWQDSGRLRGFGHVVFASQETRAHALSDNVNGKELGGRYITVKEANAPKAGGQQATRPQPSGCKTVYIRNLPYEASEEQILEAFRICGKIVEGGVRVVRNHASGVSKGFGYVEFKNAEGALAAVQKAAKPFGMLVLERPVFVDYDEGAMKGSFRDREGRLWKGSQSKGHASGNNNRGRGRGGRGNRGGRSGFGMGRGPTSSAW